MKREVEWNTENQNEITHVTSLSKQTYSSSFMMVESELNKSGNNVATTPDPEFHCDSGYLMGSLGLLLQFTLAVLAFTSLIGNVVQSAR